MKEVFFECKVLSQKIIKFKEKNNLTYQQFGDALGVDKSYLNRIVKLYSYPSLPILIRLARYMEIPLYTLFIPSDELLREEFIKIAKEKMSAFNLSFDNLGEQTGILPIRLMEIFAGNSPLKIKEHRIIASALDISKNTMCQENKITMLETLIAELGLLDPQKENVMKYIKESL